MRDFLGDCNHLARLHINYLIILVLADHFVARSRPLSVLTSFRLLICLFHQISLFRWLHRLQIVEIVLSLPSTRAQSEQIFGELALEPPSGNLFQTAERAVHDCHLNLVRQVTRRYAPQGPPIDSDRPPNADLRRPQEIIYLVNISPQNFRRRFSLASPVSTIIPHEDVHALIIKHLQVEPMCREHDRLIKHRIGVANDKRWSLFVEESFTFLKARDTIRVVSLLALVEWNPAELPLVLLDHLTTLPEKHSVQLATILGFDPVMFRFVLFLQYVAQLLRPTEQYTVEAAT